MEMRRKNKVKLKKKNTFTQKLVQNLNQIDKTIFFSTVLKFKIIRILL